MTRARGRIERIVWIKIKFYKEEAGGMSGGNWRGKGCSRCIKKINVIKIFNLKIKKNGQILPTEES